MRSLEICLKVAGRFIVGIRRRHDQHEGTETNGFVTTQGVLLFHA